MTESYKKDDAGVFWIRLNPNVGAPTPSASKPAKLPPFVKCLNCDGGGKDCNGIRGKCSFCNGKGKLRDESNGYIPPRQVKKAKSFGLYRRESDGSYWVRMDPKLRFELASSEKQRAALQELYDEAMDQLNDLRESVQVWKPAFWYHRLKAVFKKKRAK